MDISVSRLNKRMALQVPGELPLGLVFIVGRVTKLYQPREGDEEARQGDSVVFFDLIEGRHRLHCQLPRRVAQETLLRDGDRVRVGGRLVFSRRLAGYYLVASDVEVLPHRRPDTSLRPILEDAQARARQTAMAPAELPPWVQKLAPPEVRRELGLQAEIEAQEAAEEEAEETVPEPEPLVETAAEPALSPEMVGFLSQAIDSDEEIELTAEMIADYVPRGYVPHPSAAGDGQPLADVSAKTRADNEKAPADGEAAEARSPAPDELPFDVDQTASPRSRSSRPDAAPVWRSRPALMVTVVLALLLLTLVLLLILNQA